MGILETTWQWFRKQLPAEDGLKWTVLIVGLVLMSILPPPYWYWSGGVVAFDALWMAVVETRRYKKPPP